VLMAEAAPLLVQQVLLPQMRLLVLLVPQVWPLVLWRRVFYHATYFAFAITPPDRLSNNVWPASALPSAERRFQPHYNSVFYMFLSCLPLSKRDCALRMRSVCALRIC